ncbi:unnamed protein product [Phaedon cochleariae]|uniref:Tetratricopeptide repeat protein n=1 Tax=Phaedon cochleariae TaxID=80249 RepID=A0A9P0DG88_PHACE|nr:unnamed protein product [Phaedon cochleariae]
MIPLKNIIQKIVPASAASTKKSLQLFYRCLQRLHHTQAFKISLGVVPIPLAITPAPPQPPSYSSEVTRYDVEENIAHLMTLARVSLEKGEVERAEAILEMGIKICEEYQSYMVMPYMYDILASIAFATGNLAKAEVLLVQIIEKMVHLGTPEDDSQIIDFQLRLSRIYSAYNRDLLADIGFKNCLKHQEYKIEDGDTTTKTGMLYVNCLFWYGLHKIKCDDHKSAKNLIDSAYSFSMKIKGLSPYQEMIILSTLGELNTQLGVYDIALQNIHSAILLGRGIGSLELPRFYLKLGELYMKLGSRSTAEQWLKEASNLAELFNDKDVVFEAQLILNEVVNKKD